ncbi:hypothetical protein GSI_15468 [Ganoderma sinense ZZ0214-1]|uniref:Uncharacterized protein n=1 Tax=Ganoderma sinense ZZ0214-1 TaxID=1077348 RepID=A0A2G8RMN2_9APHY|nr:hypothetical protein GSI_15468 [Ganoderma sinense ZZ0214-1]
MSHISRHDRHDEMNRTDEALTFKKPYQIVNRPAVTEHDMHEQYLKHPPHPQILISGTFRMQNESSETATNLHSWDSPVEERARKAREAESLREDILGSPGRGKPLKETIMEEMATEDSVHPQNPAS